MHMCMSSEVPQGMILITNKTVDKKSSHNPYMQDYARFDEYLSHITDEKPISARQCIKSLAQIGTSKHKYIPSILEALENADLSKYKDSMRPLIEKDIEEAKNTLTILKCDEQ